tara:strand:+ start:1472 stop:2140 length:669 start_codon:yes stop_codon:yes gene_type:complete
MTRSLRTALAVARKSLLIDRRSGETLLVITPFGAVALLIIPIAVGTEVPLLRQVGPGMYWVVLLLFGALVTLRQNSLQTPAQSRVLLLAGVPGPVQLSGNAMATGLLVLGLGAILAPVTVMLYDPNLAGWPWLIAVLPLVAAGLGMLGAIADGLVRRLGVRSSLGPLLILPLALPLLLGATQSMEAVASGRSAVPWLVLMVIVNLVLFLGLLFAGRLLEEGA